MAPGMVRGSWDRCRAPLGESPDKKTLPSSYGGEGRSVARSEVYEACAIGGRQPPQGWNPAAVASRSEWNGTVFDRTSVSMPPHVG